MGREELRRFARPAVESAAAPPPIPGTAPPAPAPATPAPASASSVKPVVPAGIEEYVLPGDGGTPSEYAPVLYGAARVQYTDTKRGIDVTRDLQALVSFANGPIPVDWERAEETAHQPETLTSPSTSTQARHLPLPPAALDKKRYADVDQGLLAMDHARPAAQGLFGAGDETGVEAE